ncbi:MAG: glycerate kinase [Georgenia sp.]
MRGCCEPTRRQTWGSPRSRTGERARWRALLSANVGEAVDVAACDALNRARQAQIGAFQQIGAFHREGNRRAVVESARTVGIDLVVVDDSLPRLGNSYGLGMQLVAACDTNVDEVLVALGGSATTDGGTGIFLALGAKIFDAVGDRIGPDENPLWRFAEALSATRGRDVSDVPGAGAAGGVGGALLALGGRMESGFGRAAAEIRLASRMRGADLVLAGEGRLDSQAAHGKVPSGVAALARSAGALVVGLADLVTRTTRAG